MKGIPAILSPSRIKKCDSMMGEKGFLRQLVGENRFRHLGFRHQRRGGIQGGADGGLFEDLGR
jgi:hypothetical protein